MIMDRLVEFADAVALNTGAAGDYTIGSSYDMTNVRDLGAGNPLYLVVTVDTAVVGPTSVEITLVSDAQSPVTAATATRHVATGAILTANLTQGRIFSVALPQEGNVYERYLGIVQTTVGAAVSAGKINAFITTQAPAHKHYPEGSN